MEDQLNDLLEAYNQLESDYAQIVKLYELEVGGDQETFVSNNDDHFGLEDVMEDFPLGEKSPFMVDNAMSSAAS